MRHLQLTTEAMKAIEEQALPDREFKRTGVKRADGLWDVPVDDDVYTALQRKRLNHESDSEAIMRIIAVNHGQVH